jgi:hypothetical protein
MADIHVEKRSTAWPWILGLAVLALLIWAFMAGRGGEERAGVATTGTTTDTRPLTRTTPAGTAATDTTQTRTAATEWPDRTTTAGTAGVAEPAPMGAAATTASTTTMAAGADRSDFPVAEIIQQPEQFSRQNVSGTARVVEVQSERGVWIEQGGERLLVLIAEPGPAGQGTTTAQTQAAAGQAGQPAASQGMPTLQPGQTIRLSGVIHDQNSAAQLASDQQAKELIAGQSVFLVAQPSDIEVQGAAASASIDDEQ